ncbi:MAG: hypothetical protein ACQCN5_01885 [Candidatus Bathyarchaeia archaeon]|jgi:hypothetical protein
MSQKEQKVRRLSNCNLSTDMPENAVVISASSQEVSLKQRKEEASKTLYITRI